MENTESDLLQERRRITRAAVEDFVLPGSAEASMQVIAQEPGRSREGVLRHGAAFAPMIEEAVA